MFMLLLILHLTDNRITVKITGTVKLWLSFPEIS